MPSSKESGVVFTALHDERALGAFAIQSATHYVDLAPSDEYGVNGPFMRSIALGLANTRLQRTGAWGGYTHLHTAKPDFNGYQRKFAVKLCNRHNLYDDALLYLAESHRNNMNLFLQEGKAQLYLSHLSKQPRAYNDLFKDDKAPYDMDAKIAYLSWMDHLHYRFFGPWTPPSYFVSYRTPHPIYAPQVIGGDNPFDKRIVKELKMTKQTHSVPGGHLPIQHVAGDIMHAQVSPLFRFSNAGHLTPSDYRQCEAYVERIRDVERKYGYYPEPNMGENLFFALMGGKRQLVNVDTNNLCGDGIYGRVSTNGATVNETLTKLQYWMKNRFPSHVRIFP